MRLAATGPWRGFSQGATTCVAASLAVFWLAAACFAQDATIRPGNDGVQPAAEVLPTPPDKGEMPKKGYRYRIAIPSDIPGASSPAISLPPYNPRDPNSQRAAVERLYHGLPDLPPRIEPQPGPNGGPVTLTELQAMALQRSPLVRQAQADVIAARGTMIQAGTPQNPNVGFEGDTIGTGHTGGYQGVAIEQMVPTGGKLRLARSAREMDFNNAQIALRRTCLDVDTAVRTAYFATLVAAETLKFNRALADFTDEVYRVQVDRVKAGEAAPYEPLQVRVLAMQAHAAVVQSTNAYCAAWRQLAAALSCPDMPPTLLAGDVSMPVPNIAYEDACCWIMENNTRLLTAQNAVAGARYSLVLARRTPWVPDLDLSATIQRDFTTLPDQPMVYTIKATVPMPLFDRNRGNILVAEGALARAEQACAAARNSLANTLADAYARYSSNRITADYYRRDIISDQVQSWRGLWERHQVDPDSVQFTDVVSAQQTLAQTIQTYAQTLAAQWQAVVDLADLMELEDLCQMGTPAIEELPPAGAVRTKDGG
jgi:outer membrane protein, heavy metal efflux system